MPNVHLTAPMQEYVQRQIKAGAYANLSEVVRAGIRLLMEKDGARQFYALKAELEDAAAAAESGDFSDFDPNALIMTDVPSRIDTIAVRTRDFR